MVFIHYHAFLLYVQLIDNYCEYQISSVYVNLSIQCVVYDMKFSISQSNHIKKSISNFLYTNLMCSGTDPLS